MPQEIYNPNMHHRRSIRLKGYDYSSEGLYFITICSQNKQCVFGHIKNGEMYLNELGQMVQDEWINTMSVRKDEVELHEFIVMPNHIHAIIEICPQSPDQGVCDTPLPPNASQPLNASQSTRRGVLHTPSIANGTGVSHMLPFLQIPNPEKGVCDTPLRSPSRTVGAIVRGFKGAVTKKAGQHIWQRNYFEHIIRSGESYQLIAEYIISNPTRWNIDRFYNI